MSDGWAEQHTGFPEHIQDTGQSDHQETKLKSERTGFQVTCRNHAVHKTT